MVGVNEEPVDDRSDCRAHQWGNEGYPPPVADYATLRAPAGSEGGLC